MSFVSKLNPGERIYDETNAHLLVGDPVIDGVQMSRGLQPRDLSHHPFGSMPFAESFPRELIIPRSEWPDRIAEMERTKSRISDICDQAGLPCKDQNGTNYCWINAPTHCVEIVRLVQGQPMVILSPASAGGPIKGFRNVGGWGTEGLEWIVENGVVPVDKWPANAIDRRYYTAENKEIARKYRIVEWWDIPTTFDAMMSCLFRRIPVAIGLNWWSHEVTAVDPVKTGSNSFGARIRNSWGMNWEDRGYAVLSESKATPDDAVGPRSAIPTDN